jgi:hypothetical protein
MFGWIEAIFSTKRKVDKMTLLVTELAEQFNAVNTRLVEAQAETAAAVKLLNDQIAALMEQLNSGPAAISEDAQVAFDAMAATAQMLADQFPEIPAPPVE